MCGHLKESSLGECLGTSGEEGTLPRGDRPILRPRPKKGRRGCTERPKLVPRGGAARSGHDQAQERARSGRHAAHAAENGTLRLTKKAPSCRQRWGFVGYR